MNNNNKTPANVSTSSLSAEELAIIQEKFDDLLITSLNRPRVVQAIKEDTPFVLHMRSVVIANRNDGVKTHVIMKHVKTETKKAGFYQNPHLQTSAGYIQWLKGLNISNLPQGLTQDDWDKAADLCSSFFCDQRTKLKKAAINGAFDGKWSQQDGKKVEPKDLRAFFETKFGRDKLDDWLFAHIVKGQSFTRQMFEPSKPLQAFVSQHMSDYGEKYPTLKAALAAMTTQHNADKLQHVEEDLQAAYETATNVRVEAHNNNNNTNTNNKDAETVDEDREDIDLAALTSQPELHEVPTRTRSARTPRRASTTKEKPSNSQKGKKRKSTETDVPQLSPKTNKRQKVPS